MIEFNPDSNQHLSCLLFGGTLIEELKELSGTFKTGSKKGLDKYKNIKLQIKIVGLGLNPLPEWKTKKEGIYQTNEDVLNIISKQKGTHAAKIVETILHIRGLQKQISTYYISTEEAIYTIDNCVHGSYIHVITDTGRLGHRNPNLGNQPKKPSKATQHFISRFQNGTILISDYKSIEPRVEAEQCQDKNYINDVINELDTHTKNLALAERVSYKEAEEKVTSGEWKDKRSKIKGFTFAQQYLASVKTTAKNSGLTEQEVVHILNARKEEYPDLYKWHEKNIDFVNKNLSYKSIFGREFIFKMKYGEYGEYLSKNEVANYITQGTSADIVNMMIGKFWREKAIYNRDKYLMINTVHDNLMLDCKEEFIEDAKKDLKLLENVQEMVYNNFNYTWIVPIKIEISLGKRWYDCL